MNTLEQEQREAEEAVAKELGIEKTTQDRGMGRVDTGWEVKNPRPFNEIYSDAIQAAVRRELKLRAYQRAEEELETSRVEEVNAERECMEERDVDGAMIRARKVNMILRCQNIIRKHLKAIQ